MNSKLLFASCYQLYMQHITKKGNILNLCGRLIYKSIGTDLFLDTIWRSLRH